MSTIRKLIRRMCSIRGKSGHNRQHATPSLPFPALQRISNGKRRRLGSLLGPQPGGRAQNCSCKGDFSGPCCQRMLLHSCGAFWVNYSNMLPCCRSLCEMFSPTESYLKRESKLPHLYFAWLKQLLQIAIRCQRSLPWPIHPRTSRALHRSSLLPRPRVQPNHPEVRATPMKRQIRGGSIPVPVR